MTKSFDHLLRETLKGPVPEPPEGCLDAGVLAAWFEGTLDPVERAAAEAHAAECSRCQAVLAAMIRIEPPMESRPWWRSPAFGWLVPITVAAAALMVYVRVDRHPLSPQVEVAPAPIGPTTTTPSADQASAEQAPEETARDSVASTAAPRPPASLARSKETARLEALGKRVEQAQIATESPAAPPPALEPTPLKDRVGVPVDELTLQKAAAAAATSPAPAPTGSPGAVLTTAVPPSAAPAPPARLAEDRSRAAAAPEKGSLAESVIVSAGTGPATPRQPQVVVQTADGSTRWRILAPGSVQRSNDAGATWETQSTGVSVIVSSGAAPSKSVCWLVGKGGIVLLSADGRAWRQVPFPQSVDLSSVVATDASSATVTTASGRTFTTVDGGRNWK